MKNARKIFSAVVIALLAIVILFTLAGCGDNNFGKTEPMSVRISFGESFMEASGLKAAGVTPYEWRDYLKEENKYGRASIFVEDGEVILQIIEDDENYWKMMGVEKIEELCREFSVLDESCSIELFENNSIADVSYDEDISRETAEEYVAQVRKWCAYLHEFDYDKYSLLEQVNYTDTPMEANEIKSGISFENIVCEFEQYDDIYSGDKVKYNVETSYTIYANGAVVMDMPEMGQMDIFLLTENQLQTIKNVLQRYRVWTIKDHFGDGNFVIKFYDAAGTYMDYSCGSGSSAGFDRAANAILETLTKAQSQADSNDIVTDETMYGISFEKIVCCYAYSFDNDPNINYSLFSITSDPNFDYEKYTPPIRYTVYADGTVEVERGYPYSGWREVNRFTMTETQVQAVINALRQDAVWTEGLKEENCYTAERFIHFFNSDGVWIYGCGGNGLESEVFDRAANSVESIITEQYPLCSPW